MDENGFFKIPTTEEKDRYNYGLPGNDSSQIYNIQQWLAELFGHRPRSGPEELNFRREAGALLTLLGHSFDERSEIQLIQDNSPEIKDQFSEDLAVANSNIEKRARRLSKLLGGENGLISKIKDNNPEGLTERQRSCFEYIQDSWMDICRGNNICEDPPER